MGMAAKLKVNTGTLGAVKMIGLMVEQNGVFASVGTAHKLRHAAAMQTAAVVAAYDAQLSHACHAVAQQRYAGVGKALLRLRLAAEILMIAKTGVHGSVKTAQL